MRFPLPPAHWPGVPAALRCWVLGHDPTVVSWRQYGYTKCQRCGCTILPLDEQHWNEALAQMESEMGSRQ